MAKVNTDRLIEKLIFIRAIALDPHPYAMAFDGYVAACMHLEAITPQQFMILCGLSSNACIYRNQELRK